MGSIVLQGRYTVLFDDDDADDVLPHAWRVRGIGRLLYVRRTTYGPHAGRKTVMMHRELLDAKRGQVVDHINGNTLDNRRCNLRLCTHQQNMQNARKTLSGRTSRFKGVYLQARSQKWVAVIRVDKKLVYIGSFVEEGEAARAYDEAAVRAFGEFARPNFPLPRKAA